VRAHTITNTRCVLLLHYADAPGGVAAGAVAAGASAVAVAAPAAAALHLPPITAAASGSHFAHFSAGGEPAVVVTLGLCIKFDAGVEPAVVVLAVVLGPHAAWVSAAATLVTTHALQSITAAAAAGAGVVAAAGAGVVAAAGAAQIHEHPLFQCKAP